MEYNFDSQMSQIHALMGWFSLALFLARGLAFQFQQAWPMDARVRVLVFGNDLLMTVTGLSLWALRYYNPLYDGWLAGKLMALFAYTVCAHWAMGRGEFRSLGYVLSLLFLAYMIGASVTRSAALGLF